MAADAHGWLLWLHILLFVFWLGADVGVFAAAAMVRRRGMPLAERALLLRLAGLIDLSPRLCMALIAPVGLLLARPYGIAIGGAAMLAAWGIALLWAASIVAAYRAEGTPRGARIGQAQRIAFALAGCLALGWSGLLLRDPAVPGWLALKIGLFGLVFFLAIAIDLSFRPVIAAFVALGHGIDEPRETALARAIDRCLGVVATLYAVLLAASLLGTLKP